jgi:DNA-directed RNA polymerase omega subunit
MAAKRVRQLRDGADYVIDDDHGNEDVVMALREIAEGKITLK